ncbi:MAG: response regulator [Deltaproteobacteria bacterium]|jgi:signal transduction histidine kinase/ActR/RegA family two-component response regulator/HPt (histidine-containing phosphotransfer) domain-containing protein|nr:response regulator [Deltaproteobacteria bacterium]
MELPRILVVCGAFFTLFLFSYLYVTSLMEKQVDLHGRQETLLCLEELSDVIGAHEQALGTAAAVMGLALDPDPGPDATQALVEAIANDLSNQKVTAGVFSSLYGYLRGNFVDSGSNWLSGEFFDPRSAPWVRGAWSGDGVYFSPPRINPATGEVVAGMSQVVFDQRGESLGVLGIDYRLASLLGKLRAIRGVGADRAVLTDATLTVLSHPNKAYVGKKLSELPGFEAIAERLTEEPNSDDGLVSGSVESGGERLAVFFGRLDNGWRVGLGAPYRYYYGEVFQMMPVLGLVALFWCLLVSVILAKMGQEKRLSDDQNRSKTSFLARMSHEIRTPMNAILGMCELARRSADNPESLARINEIRRAGMNLLDIINDILDFSKINTGNLKLANSPWHIASLFNDVVTIIKARKPDKPLSFNFDLDTDMPSRLIGDESHIRQVVLNLLSNAVKYTPEGFVRFSATFKRIGPSQVKLYFKVKDSGIGIREEDQEKLFTDFTRINSEKSHNIEGTGLGLAIARSLCRAMGGDITVASVYGKGSTFTASIVQEVGDFTPVGAAPRSPDEVDYGGTGEVPFTAPGAKVLLVDDVETNLVVAEGLLEPYGMDLTLSQSPFEALALARSKRFDLIFVDNMMPELDGIGLVKKLREIKGYSRVPMVVLTATAIAGAKEMFLSQGFDDYLAKPIELQALADVLDEWIPDDLKAPVPDAPEGEGEGDGDGGPAAPSGLPQDGAPGRQAGPKGRLAAALGTGPAEGDPDPRHFSAAPGSPTPLRIPGIDVAKGLRRFGGKDSSYLKALALFAGDLEDRLPRLVPAHGEHLEDFRREAHGIKSAAINIGAESVWKEAAFLEAAAESSDGFTVHARCEAFRRTLAAMAADIRRELDRHGVFPDGLGGKSEPLSLNVPESELQSLSHVLEGRDIGEVDRILGALQDRANDPGTSKALQRIHEHVLLADYEEASKLINDELVRRNGR